MVSSVEAGAGARHMSLGLGLEVSRATIMKESQRKKRHKRRKPRTFSGSKKRLHHKLACMAEEKQDIKYELSTQIKINKAMKM